jgi:preprotein translocase subunit SecD
VHPRGCIDIPVAAIQRIEALETMTFYDRETGSLSTASCPRVEIWLDAHMRARIYRLTRRIIDEPLDIVVGGECVSRPIVREPLGTQSSFRISASDLAEAEALAQRLRMGWRRADLRVVC